MPDLRRCSSAFLAMNRGSRLYIWPVMGSLTSQMRNRVLWERTGSIVAESGSGMRSMSLSLIAWNPRMLEPSNPRPSVKLSTSSSASGRLKCCHVPGRSMKRTSTTSTPSAFARSRTSRGLVFLPDLVSTAINALRVWGFDGSKVIVRTPEPANHVWFTHKSRAPIRDRDLANSCHIHEPPVPNNLARGATPGSPPPATDRAAA